MTEDDTRPIGPTPERLAKAGRDVEAYSPDETLHHRAIRMLDGHVLERLASRGVISGDQYHAGTRFYADWYYSGLAASGVIDPGRVIVDGGQVMHESDLKLTAMTKWKRAVQGIGMIHCQVLTSCVLNEEDMATYGSRRYGQKAPKLARLMTQAALIDALSALDLHYYGERTRRAHVAHADDYRPTVQNAEEGT